MSINIRDKDEYLIGSKWYSDWHRKNLGNLSTMIDIDGFDYCPHCSEGIFIVEATRSKTRKTATVVENIARGLNIVAIVAYAGRDGDHDGQMLLDNRTTGDRYGGWMSEERAREILLEIRSRHVCKAIVERNLPRT